MEDIIQKAKTLMEALPYIKKFRGKRIVIKYGGHAMEDDSLKDSFTRDIIMLKLIGVHPIVVHGGGPQIEKVLTQMGIIPKFHEGLRITDDRTMDVVEMVLVGKVNKEIVGLINHNGGRAVGLSGKDGRLIQATKMDPQKVKTAKKTTELIDLGRVGAVSSIDPEIITEMEEAFFIPVIAPVGVSEAGESLNINADFVAGAIAIALKAEKLILMTDIDGVKDASGKLISTIKMDEIDPLIKKGVITGGMIPKLQCTTDALKSGVSTAHIIDGRVQHAVLLEIFTDTGVGTLIQR